MGAHSAGSRSVGVIHSGEFDRWISWLLYKSSFYSFAGFYSCSSCDHWRHRRFAFGQQTFRCPSNFAFLSDGPPYCRHETNFYEVNILQQRHCARVRKTGRRPVVTEALASAPFPATMGWLCSRTRRFDRCMRAKARKAPRHPIHDVAERRPISSFPRGETSAQLAANAGCVLHALDARNSSEDGQMRRLPESDL